jgi:hypothetical protein
MSSKMNHNRWINLGVLYGDIRERNALLETISSYIHPNLSAVNRSRFYHGDRTSAMIDLNKKLIQSDIGIKRAKEIYEKAVEAYVSSVETAKKEADILKMDIYAFRMNAPKAFLTRVGNELEEISERCNDVLRLKEEI